MSKLNVCKNPFRTDVAAKQEFVLDFILLGSCVDGACSFFSRFTHLLFHLDKIRQDNETRILFIQRETVQRLNAAQERCEYRECPFDTSIQNIYNTKI